MPHINIKHFPVPLSETQKDALVLALSKAVCEAFGCPDELISIALEPIAPDQWRAQVYLPEVELRKKLLCKMPNY